MSITLGPTPCRSRIERWSRMGHGERPSWFTTTVVTPWDTTFGAAFRSSSSVRIVAPPMRALPSSAWEWMSMKPGET